jgi:ankyrin repeat protein
LRSRKPRRRSEAEPSLRQLVLARDWTAVEARLGAGVKLRVGEPLGPLVGAMVVGDAPPQLVSALLARLPGDESSSADLATAASLAASRGRTELLSILLDEGVSPDTADHSGLTLLMFALASGHDETAQLLLERGADPCARSARGRTPLLCSLGRVPIATVRRLLDAGADASGPLPIYEAVRADSPELLSLLYDSGADSDRAARLSAGAVHAAAASGANHALAWLLSQGADPDAPGVNGQTPLIDAIESFKGDESTLLEVVEVLLTAGADPTRTTASGHTAANRAQAHGRFRVLARLDPERRPAQGYAEVQVIVLRDDERHAVFYRPNDPVDTFVIGVGHWHDRAWGSSSARTTWERDRPLLEAAGLRWFLPLLERIAGGEVVPLEELKRVHRKHQRSPLVVRRFGEDEGTRS